MLDDLPLVVETEDVHAGVPAVAGPALVAVQDDVAGLGDHQFELHRLAWIIPRHLLEMVDEGLFAVADVRVVLDVPDPAYRSIACRGLTTLLRLM